MPSAEAVEGIPVDGGEGEAISSSYLLTLQSPPNSPQHLLLY
jgi:hypothetical protein